MTAGSVGAIAAPSSPADVHPKPSEDGDAARGGEGAEHAERRDRDERAPEAPPADPEAAVEEDHDQRHGRHLHDRLRRDVEAREEVRRKGGDDETRRRERDRQPLHELRREERDRDRARDEQDPAAEDGDVVHGEGTLAIACPAAHKLLTFPLFTAYLERKYSA
jgi:hypothetical protein